MFIQITGWKPLKASFFLAGRLTLCHKAVTMNRSAAEEHLRVIRELMERATIYRAVSAPAALFCGLTALLISGLALIPGPLQLLFQHNFVLVWVIVCILSVAANFFFLFRSTERRQERFTSYRLQAASRAVAPSFIIAIALTFFLARAAGSELFIAVCWMALYGLALLSTMSFAPRSIVVLGWAFILTSVVILCLMTPVLLLAGPDHPRLALEQVGYFAMAGSFGLYHTIYGVLVMFSARQDEHG
jgi:FtsH-binding integral membrane protein